MARFERSTVIDAPLAEVWKFHRKPASLEAVTPEWLHLTVDAVEAPTGEPTETFTEGTRVSLSMRPFGIGPSQHWTSAIVELSRDDDRAVFTDEMLEGPFPRWVHTHRFVAIDGATRMTDRVAYRLPIGPLGGLSTVAWPGFAAVFADRHRRTRRLLGRSSR